MSDVKFTPGPWEYVPSTENHGPYVHNEWGSGNICDCYTMTNPNGISVVNGGDSKPVPFQGEEADANARLIAAAPDFYDAASNLLSTFDELQATTTAERIITGRSDADLRKRSNEALAELRAAIAKAEGRQS